MESVSKNTIFIHLTHSEELLQSVSDFIFIKHQEKAEKYKPRISQKKNKPKKNKPRISQQQHNSYKPRIRFTDIARNMKNHQGISLLYIRIDQENIFFVAETAVTVATDCKYE